MLTKLQDIDEITGGIRSERVKRWTSRWDDSKGYKVPYNILGCKIFTCLPYPDTMSVSDVGRFHLVQKWCMRETHLLGYRSHGAIRAMSPKEIYDQAQLSERRGREWLSGMIKLGMIAKVTVKWKDTERDEYYTNPAYGLNGQWLSASLFIMFQDSLKKVISPWESNRFLMMAKEMGDK